MFRHQPRTNVSTGFLTCALLAAGSALGNASEIHLKAHLGTLGTEKTMTRLVHDSGESAESVSVTGSAGRSASSSLWRSSTVAPTSLVYRAGATTRCDAGKHFGTRPYPGGAETLAYAEARISEEVHFFPQQDTPFRLTCTLRDLGGLSRHAGVLVSISEMMNSVSMVVIDSREIRAGGAITLTGVLSPNPVDNNRLSSFKVGIFLDSRTGEIPPLYLDSTTRRVDVSAETGVRFHTGPVSQAFTSWQEGLTEFMDLAIRIRGKADDLERCVTTERKHAVAARKHYPTAFDRAFEVVPASPSPGRFTVLPVRPRQLARFSLAGVALSGQDRELDWRHGSLMKHAAAAREKGILHEVTAEWLARKLPESPSGTGKLVKAMSFHTDDTPRSPKKVKQVRQKYDSARKELRQHLATLDLRASRALARRDLIIADLTGAAQSLKEEFLQDPALTTAEKEELTDLLTLADWAIRE